MTDRDGNATGGLRKALYDNGKAAVDASDDPMIALARALDPAARAIRRRFETEVEGPLNKQEELLAKARFAVFGQATYPDATFTLRLSYGAVQGYQRGRPDGGAVHDPGWPLRPSHRRRAVRAAALPGWPRGRDCDWTCR